MQRIPKGVLSSVYGAGQGPHASEQPDAGRPATPPYPLCLTRRIHTLAMSMCRWLHRHRWPLRASVLAVVLGAAQAQWGTPLIVTLGCLAILLFTFEMFPIVVDLPIILWFTVAWAIMSVTALLDLLAFTKHLLRPQNQIALLVTGINIVFVLAICACIVFIRWT